MIEEEYCEIIKFKFIDKFEIDCVKKLQWEIINISKLFNEIYLILKLEIEEWQRLYLLIKRPTNSMELLFSNFTVKLTLHTHTGVLCTQAKFCINGISLSSSLEVIPMIKIQFLPLHVHDMGHSVRKV